MRRPRATRSSVHTTGCGRTGRASLTDRIGLAAIMPSRTAVFRADRSVARSVHSGRTDLITRARAPPRQQIETCLHPGHRQLIQPQPAEHWDEIPSDMLVVGVQVDGRTCTLVSQNSNHRATVHACDAIPAGPLSTTARPAACAACGER